MSKTLVTGDTHLGHANIIIHSKRPFLQEGDTQIETFVDKEGNPYEKTVWTSKTIKYQRAKEMTDDHINRWNSVVDPTDTVIHFGDFAFGSTAFLIQCLRRLNGNIKFIWGNHDDSLKQVSRILDFYSDVKGRFTFLGDYAELKVEGQDIVCMHYAMRTWNRMHHGVWQLYGHSHGSLSDDPNALSFDVGMDCHNSTPLTFERVKEIMATKAFKPKDHHI